MNMNNFVSKEEFEKLKKSNLGIINIYDAISINITESENKTIVDIGNTRAILENLGKIVRTYTPMRSKSYCKRCKCDIFNEYENEHNQLICADCGWSNGLNAFVFDRKKEYNFMSLTDYELNSLFKDIDYWVLEDLHNG